MKTRLINSKILFVLLFGFFSLFLQNAQGGEFLIMDRTYTYSYHGEGGVAFDLHSHPDGSMPSNWLSPDNYWNGSFYAYYEVIDVATDEPFGFQMGVYQYMTSEHDIDYLYETCSYGKPELRGVGDVVTFNYGSPANWWHHWNGPVDFSKVYDFESVGPGIWSLVPGAEGNLSPASGGGVDAAWAIKDNWLPCTIRAIIVAVSEGSTFSGWEYYLGGSCTPAPQSTPTYGIEYSSERTNKAVPSTDEYSYNSDMSEAVSGTGQKLSLIPGQDVYFRTKELNECLLASAIQHLEVPARPETPSFSVDFINEKTDQNVYSDIEYSTSASYNDPISGTGGKISLSPGQDLYLWVKATSGSFASNDYHLVVPNRPATPSFTIDFINVRTVQNILPDVEYSTSATFAGSTNGAGNKITVTPGQDLYFRTKATTSTFASAAFLLDIAERPASPTVTINYPEEKTVESFTATVEYSLSASYTNPISGTGTRISLTPGQDLYIWAKATSGSFASNDYHLVVPNRPDVPSFTIDFGNEETMENVSSDMEYSTAVSFTGSSTGTGNKVSLTPGQDLYIRVKASANTFASTSFFLDVPARPSSPIATINYPEEKTVESFAATVEYSTSASYINPISGTGTQILLTPGQDLYLWVKHSISSFASMVYQLVVPERPVLAYTGEDTVSTASFSISAILDNSMIDFDLTDISVINGQAQNLHDNTFDIYPDQKGDVHVIIPFNSFAGASFASNEVTVYSNYSDTSTGILLSNSNSFSILPNPSNTGIIYVQTNIEGPYTIDIISGEGRILRKIKMFEGNCQQLYLEDLKAGIYFLKMVTHNYIGVQKLILE